MESFDDLIITFQDFGCERLFIKKLSKNDNSKQQIYLGPSFDVLSHIPPGEIVQKEGMKRETWWTTVDLSWLGNQNQLAKAPYTKLILYPKYPEIRLSGFLRGCKNAPNEILTSRGEGRILFLGIKDGSEVIAFVCNSDHNVVKTSNSALDFDGVFSEYPLRKSVSGLSALDQLMNDLREIHQTGWIGGQRLNSEGEVVPCNAQNAIGYTLESQLGIKANGLPGPDKLGWEIKAHTVAKWDAIPSKPLSLITTEPDGGVYVDEGLKSFIGNYGYTDSKGDGRYGGIHKVGQLGRSSKNRENLRMSLVGFDEKKMKISEPDGFLCLEDHSGEIAASWSFRHMLERWTKKHNKTMFVPALAENSSGLRSYYYGDRIRLGYNSDFPRLLNALHNGDVYLDPMPVIYSSGGARKRSMFRINMKSLPVLFERFEEKSLIYSGFDLD